MHYSHFVTVDESIENGSNNISRLPFVEGLFCQNLIEKLAALQQLHHNVEVLFILSYGVQLYYVGVVDLLHNVNFVLECQFVLWR